MRKFFTKIHLWLAVPAGVVIAVVCLSGAALVFETEITRALDPGLYRVEYRPGTVPLAPSELVARIAAQVPDTLRLGSVRLAGDPAETVLASFENAGRRTLSVDPYTGRVNGWTKSYPFFQTMRRLHRWLLDAPPRKGDRTVGKTVVGVSTFLLVFILISGVAIWIPRRRKNLKNRLTVSCLRGRRRFWYDCHVVLGFYSAAFLLVMALTGLTWSFGWYRSAAYSLFGGGTQSGEKPVSHREGAGGSSAAGEGGIRGREGRGDASVAFDYTVWDCVIAGLRAQYPVYRSVTLSVKNAQIAPDPHTSMRKTDTALFDPRTGRIKRIDTYRDAPRSLTLKSWFYAFHTGSWGGVWTKVVYLITALIGGTLPLTGYYLWLKKKYFRKN